MYACPRTPYLGSDLSASKSSPILRVARYPPRRPDAEYGIVCRRNGRGFEEVSKLTA